MAKTFEVAFNNFVKDGQFDKLPDYKGIYMFRVTENKGDKWYSTIVYIGKADGDKGLKGRVNENHEHLEDARKKVDYKKSKGIDAFLTISYSDKNDNNVNYLERIEAALIFAKQPSINNQGKDSFNYQKTTLNISGKRKYDLDNQYIVESTK